MSIVIHIIISRNRNSGRNRSGCSCSCHSCSSSDTYFILVVEMVVNVVGIAKGIVIGIGCSATSRHWWFGRLSVSLSLCPYTLPLHSVVVHSLCAP